MANYIYILIYILRATKKNLANKIQVREEEDTRISGFDQQERLMKVCEDSQRKGTLQRWLLRLPLLY